LTVLQCVAVCCSVLQYITTRVAMCCGVRCSNILPAHSLFCWGCSAHAIDSARPPWPFHSLPGIYICICMYICMYVYMHIHTCVYIHIYTYINIFWYKYIYMYVYIYVCVCVYIYIDYIYIYVYVFFVLSRFQGWD